MFPTNFTLHDWLTGLFSLLATTLMQVHAQEERTFVFNTGIVTLVEREEAVVDLNITGFGSGSNVTTAVTSPL